MDLVDIDTFIRESNEIEGIFTVATADQIGYVAAFLDHDLITVGVMAGLASLFQLGVLLRDRVGLDVMVGSHLPPRGGPEVRAQLEDILDLVVRNEVTPWYAHCAYENLHPFTDCNGRTGRLLWLWHMNKTRPGFNMQISFLHKFYYQTLTIADSIMENHEED